MHAYVIGVFAAFAIGTGSLVTALVRNFAIKIGAINAPNPIVPQHVVPVAYLGGVAVGVSSLGVVAVTSRWGAAFGFTANASNTEILQLVFPGVLFLALGLYDDLRPLQAFPKLFLQCLVAAIAVAMGLVFPATGSCSLDVMLSAFWIVTVVNAFNFTDVCDGLVAGLSIITLLFFALALGTQSLIASSVALCCVGFLLHNAPPAKIFLGDAGSHLLGFLSAALALQAQKTIPLWPGIAVMILALGVPLFELVFITSIRIAKRIPWWRGSPDHFSLRLQAAGFSRVQTDLLAWSGCVTFCGVAWYLLNAPLVEQALLLGLTTLLAVWCGRWLRRWEVGGRSKKADPVLQVESRGQNG